MPRSRTGWGAAALRCAGCWRERGQAVGGVSETILYRSKMVEKFRPDLLPAITSGTLKVWPAYRQALQERDRLAVLAASGH